MKSSDRNPQNSAALEDGTEAWDDPEGGQVPPSSPDAARLANARRQRSQLIYYLYSVLFVILVGVIALAPRIFNVVGPGELGVKFTLLSGTVLDKVYEEGLHLLFPVNRLYIYDVRFQERAFEDDVLSYYGLTVRVRVSCQFRPIRAELPSLHKEIGPDYERKLVSPTILMAIRQVIGNYHPEELYTTHRITVQEEISRVANEDIRGRHVELLGLRVLEIRLPDTINAAIQQKLRHQQESQEYEFRLQKEHKEAERRLIEARGLENFNQTLAGSLTNPVLIYRGIQATEALAQSPNAKFILQGSSKEGIGLPIILGNTGFDAGGGGVPAARNDRGGRAPLFTETAAPAALAPVPTPGSTPGTTTPGSTPGSTPGTTTPGSTPPATAPPATTAQPPAPATRPSPGR